MTSPSSMTSLMGYPIYGVSPSSLDGLFMETPSING